MPDLTPDPVLEEINSPTPLKAKKASSDGDDESYQARGRSDSRDVIHITRYNEFDSDESNESSIVSDDAMNDEEAEKVVKELLGKYTTLGAVVGELSVSG